MQNAAFVGQDPPTLAIVSLLTEPAPAALYDRSQSIFSMALCQAIRFLLGNSWTFCWVCRFLDDVVETVVSLLFYSGYIHYGY